MIDKMIEVALAVLMVGVIIAIVKLGGFAASVGVSKIKKSHNDRKYPITSLEFPINALSMMDKVTLENIGVSEYQGKSNGRYFIAFPKGIEIDGNTYKYFSADELRKSAIELSNDKVVKWSKSL